MRILSRRSLIGANILWALVVFTLCAMPGDSVPDTGIRIPHFDKVVHFGMFFITNRSVFSFFQKTSISFKSSRYFRLPVPCSNSWTTSSSWI